MNRSYSIPHANRIFPTSVYPKYRLLDEFRGRVLNLKSSNTAYTLTGAPIIDVTVELMKDLARRLLAVEAASQSDSDSHVPEAVRVYGKLRISLTRFAGPEGFTALMRRALALAREEVPTLKIVHIRPDGSIEGLVEISTESTDRGSEATIAITANLLTLLVTFIGESLTLRLISDAWPNDSLVN